MPTDARSGARYFVDALETVGVRHLFGNPGTTELPIIRALATSDIEYILTLHEDVAVGMAAGYAVGQRHRSGAAGPPPIGVANLHVAPGVAHGLCNLYNAHRAGIPVLVTAGEHATGFRSANPLLAGDLVAMTEQFTKWSAAVDAVDALPTMLERAIETALTPPTGPVFLSLPLDVQRATVEAPPPPTIDVEPPAAIPEDAVDAAAEVLLEAESPVLVVGDRLAQGGRASIEAAVAFAEAVGARVHGEVLAAEVAFPQTHPLWVSPLPPDEERIRTLLDADTVVLAGVETIVPLTSPSAPLLSPDTDIVVAGYDVPPGLDVAPAVTLTGDPGRALGMLTEEVGDAIDPATISERRDAIDSIAAFVDAMLEQLASPVEPVEGRLAKPTVVETLDEVAPDAYLVDESVTASYALRAGVDLEPGRYLFAKGSGLGYGVAAAMGVALVEGAEPVVCFVGDGSLLYYPQALFTAARYDLDLTVLVVDNEGYRILKDNMRAMFEAVDESEFIGMDLAPAIDLAGLARAQSVEGWSVATRDSLSAALESAIDADGPAVVAASVHD